MDFLYRTFSRERIEIREELAGGGEGSIYATNKPHLVAKIYTSFSAGKFRKLEIMVKNPPEIHSLKENHVSFAWPIDLLEEEQGKKVGFLMPKIVNGKSLLYVYNHKLRQKHLPDCDWLCLHIISQNLASTIQALHNHNIIIGDLKPDNIFVNSSGLISIIDVDSFQITDSSSNEKYRCGVTSEEYTPPELIGKDLGETDHTEVQDRFGLAVIIWLLLFGSHPFSGVWSVDGQNGEEPPSIDMRIKNGYWAFAPNSPIKPAPSTIPIKIIHPKIQELFYRCFVDGDKDIKFRPPAEEWFHALRIARSDLETCLLSSSHYFSKISGTCYWCKIKEKYNLELFPAKQSLKNEAVETQVSLHDLEVLPAEEMPRKSLQAQSNSKNRLSRIFLSAGAFLGLCLFYLFYQNHDFSPPSEESLPNLEEVSETSCNGIAEEIRNTDKKITNETNKIFWERHPELNGRALTAENKDKNLREEWCDIARNLLNSLE
jgi:DNA-binding helix-hairpin-helix protein with protein kinase domain